MAGNWTACGPDGDAMRLVRMAGRDVRDIRICAIPEAADDAGLDAGDDAGDDAAGGPVLRIGLGAPGAVPAAALPAPGADLPDLVQASPPDRMDGWTRLTIAGFLAGQPQWDGVVCVAGPAYSHWAHVSAGEIVSFQSFLTGRLVTALGGAAKAAPDAVADSLSRPERLAADLRRAEIAGRPEAITGHLTGAELAAARPYWLGRQVAVIGDAAPQAAALSAQGVPVHETATAPMRAAGLVAVGEVLGLIG